MLLCLWCKRLNFWSAQIYSFTKNIRVNTFEKVQNLDYIIICLPTPLKNKNLPDLSIVKNVLKKINIYLRHNQCLCFESTTYPESTEKLFLQLLKKKFILGKNFYLVYYLNVFQSLVYHQIS